MTTFPRLVRAAATAAFVLLTAACSSRPPAVAAPAPAASAALGTRAPMCVREGDSCVAPGSTCCAGLVCVGFRNSFCAPKP